MAYTAEEILVAAQVLELAQKMAATRRHKDWQAWRNAFASAPSKEENEAKQAELDGAHSSADFLAPAMAELKRTADAIRALSD